MYFNTCSSETVNLSKIYSGVSVAKGPRPDISGFLKHERTVLFRVFGVCGAELDGAMALESSKPGLQFWF